MKYTNFTCTRKKSTSVSVSRKIMNCAKVSEGERNAGSGRSEVVLAGWELAGCAKSALLTQNIPRLASRRCCVRTGPPICSGPNAHCACSEVHVYKQRLVDKQSCTQRSPDNMASDLTERLSKYRDEISPIQYFLMNNAYPPASTVNQRRLLRKQKKRYMLKGECFLGSH